MKSKRETHDFVFLQKKKKLKAIISFISLHQSQDTQQCQLIKRSQVIEILTHAS